MRKCTEDMQDIIEHWEDAEMAYHRLLNELKTIKRNHAAELRHLKSQHRLDTAKYRNRIRELDRIINPPTPVDKTPVHNAWVRNEDGTCFKPHAPRRQSVEG